MSPKAYSYIRFSTPEQIKGDSIRRQTELSEEYARKNGLILDRSLNLQDLGVSAYTGKHRDSGALGGFLKIIDAGKIENGSVLMIESLDRLSREEIFEALDQFLSIIRRGIKIVTLADNREYTKETINSNVAELMISLSIMARAHEESAIKSLRLSEAWQAKRDNIAIRKLTKKCPEWLKLSKDQTEYLSIKNRAEVIRRIFEMKLSGKGVMRIVRELNSLPSIWKSGHLDGKKKGDGWRGSYIKKILKNRSVIGEYQPHRLLKGKRVPVGKAISNYFPAVVAEDVFYRVQEQFRQNTYKGGRTGLVNNLFSHIAKCGYCGGSMVFIDKGPAPKGGQYLVCDRARRRSMNCRSLPIRYDELERLALFYCKGLEPKDILNQDIGSELETLRNELEGKICQLKAIDLDINNLADSIATTPDKRVRARLEEGMCDRFNKKESIKRQIQEMEQQIHKQSRASEDTKLTLDSVKELMNILQIVEKNRLIEIRLKLRKEIRSLIERIDIYPGGRPYFTTEMAQEALSAIRMNIPEDEVEILREKLHHRVKKPKDFRCFMIHFASESWRMIYPAKYESGMALSLEFDKEKKLIRNQRLGQDGRIIIEDTREHGPIVKHYRKIIANDIETLHEIIDEESKRDELESKKAFLFAVHHLNRI